MAASLAPKRWYRLIPIAFITYSLAYLDRANFGFATAGGMAKDLNITAATSSLLGSLFFLGYFFFQIPGALYAANKSAKKLRPKFKGVSIDSLDVHADMSAVKIEIGRAHV